MTRVGLDDYRPMQRIELLAPIATLAAAFTVVWAQPASVPSAGATGASRAASGLTGGERRDWERIHRVSKIIGTDVRNREGQKIGDLKDLIIDNKGNVSLAIVSTGGFLGLNDRLHAVPWSALLPDDTGSRLLDMDKAQLSRVAGFSERHGPDLTERMPAVENCGEFDRLGAAPPRSTSGRRAAGLLGAPARQQQRAQAGHRLVCALQIGAPQAQAAGALAYAAHAHQHGHGQHRAGDAPQPAPEHDREEHRQRAENQPASHEPWTDDVAFDGVNRHEGQGRSQHVGRGVKGEHARQ
jgi:hypothetical protein